MNDLPDIFERDADGRIHFKGSRIRLIDVAQRYDEGHAAEAILVDFYPTLSLAQIYRAIAFHLEHAAEIRMLIDQNEAAVERLRSGAAPTPSLAELRTRLERRRRAEASS
jgi:uncharacterized protein (DUF433 family)